MATRKKKVVGVGKLRTVKPTAAPVNKADKPHCLRMGTPNQLGEVLRFKTEKQLRDAVTDNLNTIHVPWCKRYNNAGLEVIQEIQQELSNTTITTEVKRIERTLDEHYNVMLCYAFWKD